VLVAEDSDTERAIFVNALRDAGLEVHEAPDGRYALDLSRMIHPDVLVLDLGLPRLGGIEVLRRLRDDRKISQTPVIVLTADGRAETADLAFYEGATDFVAKPVDPAELVARVREVADGWVQTA
jgi:two-component system KDP operon response regulator KdpE